MNRQIPNERVEEAQRIAEKLEQDIYLNREEKNTLFELYYRYLSKPVLNSRGQQLPLKHLILKAKTCGSCWKTATTTLKNVLVKMQEQENNKNGEA